MRSYFQQLQKQSFPIFPVSSQLADDAFKDASVMTSTTPAVVSTVPSVEMFKANPSGPFTSPELASKSLPVSSSGLYVSEHQEPAQASPLGGNTVGQKTPLYTSPRTACTSGSTAHFFGTATDIVSSSYCAHPHGNPTSVHASLYQASFETTPSVSSSTGEQAVETPQILQHLNGLPGCSTSFSANHLPVKESTFQDIVEIQRKQAELSQIIVTQQARSLLPSSEPPVFYGDAMEFPSFMTAFESLIESKVDDSCERLYFLGQYTSGKAKEVINGCLQRKTDGSYEEAKGLLKRHFGDPFKIANAHILKLSSWQPVRPNDGVALQNFSIALDQAKSAMKGMSHMDDLNTAHVLRQLWEKLPRHLRGKWTERNNRTKIAKGRIADFEEFSQFVREQAELATDPVFSEENVSKPHHVDRDKDALLKFRGRSFKRGKGTSFVTGLKQEDSKQRTLVCVLCNNPHNLDECDQFLKKSLSERREFVMEKKLCFGCFSNQHIAKHCKERQTCKTCNKFHPTSLHDNDWMRKPKDTSDKSPPADKPRVSSNRTAICNITEAGDVPINMGILPVWLFHKSNPAKKIKVYALLDNASGGMFVSEKSAETLGVEGSDTNLTITTIHGTRSVTAKAIEGLAVANIKEDVTLDLPRTFTRNTILADRNEIPRTEVISKIAHLKEVGAEIPPIWKRSKWDFS